MPPTSLRVQSTLRLGKPYPAKAVAPEPEGAEADPMKYVYILQSIDQSERYYVGLTDDLRARLRRHNAGDVSHTSKFAPWRVKTYVAFSDEVMAVAFERYLKTASGRAFARKRL